MRFCRICNSFLIDKTNNDKLYYKCTKCAQEYDSNASDSLRYEKKYNNDVSTSQYEILLKNAINDRATPEVFKDCTKCDRKIVKYVIIGDEMKFVYICECGNIF
tara:strand:+ start:216 stop:527 length:312 start_codon:yes stop_codon:yes gene_type:complete